MTVVVFLPDSVLLVPGAAGATGDPFADARAAAVTAVGAAVGVLAPTAPVLVVAPAGSCRVTHGPVRSGFGACGLPATMDGAGPLLNPAAVPIVGPSASVGAAMLDLAGGTRPERVCLAEVGPEPTVGFRAEVEESLGGVVPALIIVVGSGSARHGPQGPLPDDPRAPAVDDRLVAALGSGPAALGAVLMEAGSDATELAMTGVPVWRILLQLLRAAPQESVVASLLWSGTPGGAHHMVARWSVAGAGE